MESFALPATSNLAAGVAVPIIYGRTMTGSVVISANITNEQVEV